MQFGRWKVGSKGQIDTVGQLCESGFPCKSACAGHVPEEACVLTWTGIFR